MSVVNTSLASNLAYPDGTSLSSLTIDLLYADDGSSNERIAWSSVFVQRLGLLEPSTTTVTSTVTRTVIACDTSLAPSCPTSAFDAALRHLTYVNRRRDPSNTTREVRLSAAGPDGISGPVVSTVVSVRRADSRPYVRPVAHVCHQLSDKHLSCFRKHKSE